MRLRNRYVKRDTGQLESGDADTICESMRKTQPTMFDIIVRIYRPTPFPYRPREKQDTDWILYNDPMFLELAEPPILNQLVDLLARILRGGSVWRYVITDECGIISRHVIFESARKAVPLRAGEFAIHEMRHVRGDQKAPLWKLLLVGFR